uniref:Reverse transcriptase zinc-binding domain-containing protein n=1 Tax=Oryza brachyantha TaxID=4533 RepID=J3LZT4_ORYBR
MWEQVWKNYLPVIVSGDGNRKNSNREEGYRDVKPDRKFVVAISTHSRPKTSGIPLDRRRHPLAQNAPLPMRSGSSQRCNSLFTPVTVGNGIKTSFWEDSWIDAAPLKEKYAVLYSHCKQKDRLSIQDTKHGN